MHDRTANRTRATNTDAYTASQSTAPYTRLHLSREASSRPRRAASRVCRARSSSTPLQVAAHVVSLAPCVLLAEPSRSLDGVGNPQIQSIHFRQRRFSRRATAQLHGRRNKLGVVSCEATVRKRQHIFEPYPHVVPGHDPRPEHLPGSLLVAVP